MFLSLWCHLFVFDHAVVRAEQISKPLYIFDDERVAWAWKLFFVFRVYELFVGLEVFRFTCRCVLACVEEMLDGCGGSDKQEALVALREPCPSTLCPRCYIVSTSLLWYLFPSNVFALLFIFQEEVTPYQPPPHGAEVLSTTPLPPR